MNESPETRASEILRRAEELVPVLAERAAETEALRRLPDETMADIRAAGLHAMGKPERLGGAELPLDAIVRVVATLARGCASTAWVCGVYSDHEMIVGMMDPRVADEIWADEPDALIATGYFPSGTNEPTATAGGSPAAGVSRAAATTQAGRSWGASSQRGTDRPNPISAWCRSTKSRSTTTGR